MELKDLVQEVLQEIEKTENSVEKRQEEEEKVKEIQSIFQEENKETEENSQEELLGEVENQLTDKQDSRILDIVQSIEEIEKDNVSDEENFLTGLKERLLVIFEGFQSPNNQNVEAKLDLTLNFLEYLLAKVDDRLEEIDSKKE